MKQPANELDVIGMPFNPLLERYTPMLTRFANESREDPEDAFQEGSLLLWQLHEKWSTYQVEQGAPQTGQTRGSFTSYLYRRLRWMAGTWARGRSRQTVNIALIDEWQLPPDPSHLMADLDLSIDVAAMSPDTIRYVDAKLGGPSRIGRLSYATRSLIHKELRERLELN